VSVNIIGNTNTDVITTIIEALKSTSTLVTSAAPGIVYRNANVWVGTSGFATPQNIKEATIKFNIDNNWMSVNSVTSSDIVLVRWNGKSWTQLETKEVSKDGENTFFEGKTNGFSPFAITAKVGGVKPAATVSGNEIPTKSGATTQDKNSPKVGETANITQLAVSGSSTWFTILILFIINIIIIALYFRWVKK
jgi:PGF-pre-PGF domain-containing protein